MVCFVIQSQQLCTSGSVNASWWRHHLQIASSIQLLTLQPVYRYYRCLTCFMIMFFVINVCLCAVDLRGSERMLNCFSRQDFPDMSALLRLSVVGRFLNATQWHFRRFLQRNAQFVCIKHFYLHIIILIYILSFLILIINSIYLQTFAATTSSLQLQTHSVLPVKRQTP